MVIESLLDEHVKRKQLEVDMIKKYGSDGTNEETKETLL
jgi:hypothetical protein